MVRMVQKDVHRKLQAALQGVRFENSLFQKVSRLLGWCKKMCTENFRLHTPLSVVND